MDDDGAHNATQARGEALKTCSTCRFFGARNSLGVWDDNYGDIRETDHHTCARIIHGNAGGVDFHKVNVEPAIVTDGSGYAARLRVLATFGCVLHETPPSPDQGYEDRNGNGER